ncbi:DUF3263 domain-containing protein [Rhodococcus sp. IEGM 1401]|jgi:hypothetical protein|uniref:DUF3263 domain-containing protein n=1 Tax=Rhodococcus cercidiphylli TaxID=489916 RepID=A0ABU4AW45_9NOCA|nr:MULTISPECIES: DUF3263 domain-containing protein [Rhodococcus]KAA0923463.1 DUF3263 domain-containing protein [Rhodococcus sp. ANT_H53B]MCZ4561450.1 DUF3263 domain-containing protein [Rhodococcus sp. IEGM 1401]MDI9921670.1 DUF3263 domain-containing protein [Rhodococcus sp. IEGM 1372]MDI9927121.1 DUF3263 domain-containing protein [Rhodococcus sp. IEGM 1341]MDV6230466.1 DUF3263 domain-containing protein [Rhodococcus cercidiphylli]
MRRTTTHSVDHEILTFGRTWRGYGGGSDEDIYVAFGIDARTYFQRLRRILDSPVAEDLSPDERSAIADICRLRLG